MGGKKPASAAVARAKTLSGRANRAGRPLCGIKLVLKIKMARPKGFEPLTPRFVVWCSIQLSYGRMPISRRLLDGGVNRHGSFTGKPAGWQ